MISVALCIDCLVVHVRNLSMLTPLHFLVWLVNYLFDCIGSSTQCLICRIFVAG